MKSPKTKWQKRIREGISTALMLLGVFAFRSTFAEPYLVPTGSMRPTILPGDRLFVSKFAYDLKIPFTDIVLKHLHEPQRGEIVVFKYPVDPSINFVKRLVGLPGDLIEVTDGYITMNGEKLPITKEESDEVLALAAQDFSTGVYRETLGKVVHPVQRQKKEYEFAQKQRFLVPADHYFFMGDNRDNSSDSRFWGFVPKSHIKGKAVLVWLSLDWEKTTLPSVRWNRLGRALL